MDPSGGQTGSGATGSGLAPNLAAALSYVLGIITGVVFVVIEKDQYVRFHAFQSIFVSVAWIALWFALTILGIVFSLIPFLNVIFGIISILLWLVLGLGGFIVWLVLIIKAYQGERWSLPYVGPMAERYAAQQAG